MNLTDSVPCHCWRFDLNPELRLAERVTTEPKACALYFLFLPPAHALCLPTLVLQVKAGGQSVTCGARLALDG